MAGLPGLKLAKTMGNLIKLFLVLLWINKACTKECNLVINELNTDDPVKPEKFDFIELQSFCGGVSKSIPLTTKR